MNAHVNLRKEKCCAYKTCLFSVATVHGQIFSWTCQKVMKTTTQWILSLKRTCSHIGIKSGVSLLLVLRGHLKKSTLIFSGYWKWSIFIWRFPGHYHLFLYSMRSKYQSCYFKPQEKIVTEGITTTAYIIIVKSIFFSVLWFVNECTFSWFDLC